MAHLASTHQHIRAQKNKTKELKYHGPIQSGQKDSIPLLKGTVVPEEPTF